MAVRAGLCSVQPRTGKYADQADRTDLHVPGSVVDSVAALPSLTLEELRVSGGRQDGLGAGVGAHNADAAVLIKLAALRKMVFSACPAAERAMTADGRRRAGKEGRLMT
jgi:hypothetical protein